MPTTKPRVTVTATGELAHILAVESRLHPDLSPSELVTLLVRRGHASTRDAMDRATLVAALAGGVEYPSGAREALRGEWPA